MDKPKVVVYQVASVDGRLAFTPAVPMLFVLEKWQQITGEDEPLSFDVAEWLKATHEPQVWLEGSGSFVSRGQRAQPLPTFEGDAERLYEDFLPDPVIDHPDLQGWGVVVDSRGRGRNWLKWVDEGWHILILVSERTPADYLAHLRREEIPYLVVGEGRVDLRLALERLKSELDVNCVLSTAGGKLNGALLRDGLVDEINVHVFPVVIGGTETPALFDSPDLGPEEWPTRLKLISTQTLAEGHVWLRYEIDCSEFSSQEENA